MPADLVQRPLLRATRSVELFLFLGLVQKWEVVGGMLGFFGELLVLADVVTLILGLMVMTMEKAGQGQ